MMIDVGVLISVLALLVGYLGYLLNRNKTIKSDGQQDAKIQAQLEYIGKGVDDIRIDIKSNEKQIAAMGERMVRVEESSKQAHKRLDTFEKEMSKV